MEVPTLVIGLTALWLGCHQAPSRDFAASQSSDATPPSQSPDATPSSRRTIAPLDPDIIAKAEEILRNNPGAEIGTEFPFDLGGTRYVARVEQHDNVEGDP